MSVTCVPLQRFEDVFSYLLFSVCVEAHTMGQNGVQM